MKTTEEGENIEFKANQDKGNKTVLMTMMTMQKNCNDDPGFSLFGGAIKIKGRLDCRKKEKKN